MVMAAVFLTSALWAFESAPARACSCEETTTASIDRAAGAVIGSIVAIDAIEERWDYEEAFVATIDVLLDVKGNAPDQIFINSYADDGGNCGTQWRVGQEIGVLVEEDPDGRLRGGGCGEFTRDLAAQYSAPVSPGGEADVIIVGDNGAYRTVAYDGKGNPIAYGFEPGIVNQVDLCDDGATLLELVIDWERNTQAIAVRSLTSFEIIAEWPVVTGEGMLGVASIYCEAVDGSSAMLSAKEPLERQDIFGTYRVDKTGVRLVDEPYPGEPFTPSDDLWPQARTSNGTIDIQDWMQRLVRLEKPVFVEPGEGLEMKQISRGWPAEDRAGAINNTIPTTSGDGNGGNSDGDGNDGAIAASAIDQRDGDGAISLGILAAIFGGAALIVVAAYLVLNSPRD